MTSVPRSSLVLKRKLKGHTGAVSRARWSADGKYAMTCGHDKTLRLWNPLRSVNEGEEEELAFQIKEYTGPHGYEVVDVVIARDNAQFVSCGGDRAAFLWDVTSSRVLRRFEGHAQRLNAVAFNAEDTVLLTASYDQTVRCWDMRSRNREPIQIISGFKDSVTSVCCSDSEIITGCVDGIVRVHDLRAPCCHEDKLGRPVTSARLSNDKQCVLASCLGGTVVLLDKNTGSKLNAYTGHRHEQYSLESCLSFADDQVMSGSEDNQVLIWGLLDGQILHRLIGHTRPVCGVAAHPKQKSTVLTSSYDGTAALWCSP